MLHAVLLKQITRTIQERCETLQEIFQEQIQKESAENKIKKELFHNKNKKKILLRCFACKCVFVGEANDCKSGLEGLALCFSRPFTRFTLNPSFIHSAFTLVVGSYTSSHSWLQQHNTRDANLLSYSRNQQLWKI